MHTKEYMDGYEAGKEEGFDTAYDKLLQKAKQTFGGQTLYQLGVRDSRTTTLKECIEIGETLKEKDMEWSSLNGAIRIYQEQLKKLL